MASKAKKSDAAGKPAADTSKTALSSLESKSDADKVVIVSETRKGKAVMGIEKAPVAFDENGRAAVTVKEAKYFLSVPGCKLEAAKKAAAEKESESETKTDSVEETKASEEEDK